MNIQVESQSNRRVVRINGKITFEYCPVLQKRLDAVSVEEGVREVVLDFSQVPFIDSSGVGEVLRLFKRMREVDGEVVLMNPNKKLYDLFLMYRFDRFMKICSETGPDKEETS
ncbi:MAG: STAS domain-containing protein [Acidobacteria bacterium]|nr:STAS domain-containing protein [Acidobacteriota bacterium]